MITRLFKKIYKFIDQKIVVPISRFIYYLSKNLNNKQINSHNVTLKLRQETTQKAETIQEKDFSKNRTRNYQRNLLAKTLDILWR